MTFELDDALSLCAEAERHFADLTFGALGHRLRSDGGLWWTTASVAPVLVQGGSLRRHGLGRAAAALSTLPGRARFRDTFSSLDLTAHGFRADTSETWMVRAPGPVDTPAVPGLFVVRAATPEDVTVFERTTYANTGALDSYVPEAVHPGAATAAVAPLHLLIASVEGNPVATAIAVEGATVIGIQAVTTHPAFRRRGIGAALVASCCAVSPGLPTALSAAPGAVSLYRSLGFSELGPATQWIRQIA